MIKFLTKIIDAIFSFCMTVFDVIVSFFKMIGKALHVFFNFLCGVDKADTYDPSEDLSYVKTLINKKHVRLDVYSGSHEYVMSLYNCLFITFLSPIGTYSCYEMMIYSLVDKKFYVMNTRRQVCFDIRSYNNKFGKQIEVPENALDEIKLDLEKVNKMAEKNNVDFSKRILHAKVIKSKLKTHRSI